MTSIDSIYPRSEATARIRVNFPTDRHGLWTLDKSGWKMLLDALEHHYDLFPEPRYDTTIDPRFNVTDNTTNQIFNWVPPYPSILSFFCLTMNRFTRRIRITLRVTLTILLVFDHNSTTRRPLTGTSECLWLRERKKKQTNSYLKRTLMRTS